MNKQIIEVLLVEDSEFDAELTINALTDSKVTNHIHWVHDGAEALDYLFGRGAYSEREVEDKPKLILLDLKMPKMDGLQVLEAIRGNENTRRIPVVMLTSSKEEQDLIRSYDLGVNSYIVKPVEFDKFSAAISEVGFYWVLLNQPKV
jgi:two-component system response regulator